MQYNAIQYNSIQGNLKKCAVVLQLPSLEMEMVYVEVLTNWVLTQYLNEDANADQDDNDGDRKQGGGQLKQ